MSRHSLALATWFGTPSEASATGMAGWFGDYVAIYAWFLGLQLLDLMSTLTVLSQGGAEANNGPAWALAAWGPAALLGTKILLVLLTVAVWLPAASWLDGPGASRRVARPVMNGLVIVAALYYTAVVFYNLTNLAVLVR